RARPRARCRRWPPARRRSCCCRRRSRAPRRRANPPQPSPYAPWYRAFHPPTTWRDEPPKSTGEAGEVEDAVAGTAATTGGAQESVAVSATEMVDHARVQERTASSSGPGQVVRVLRDQPAGEVLRERILPDQRVREQRRGDAGPAAAQRRVHREF